MSTIYLVSIKNRLGRGAANWHYVEAPNAERFVIQRPFSHLSVGPLVATPESLKEYKRWLFKTLITSHAAKNEFTRMIDVLTQEGEIILECSCIPPKLCHGTLIKDALVWALPFGTEGWHLELKRIAAKKIC